MGLYATGGDLYGLDSNGDGQPCEGQEWGKVEQVGNGYAIRYKLVPWEVECPTVAESFTIAEYKDVAQTIDRIEVILDTKEGLICEA